MKAICQYAIRVPYLRDENRTGKFCTDDTVYHIRNALLRESRRSVVVGRNGLNSPVPLALNNSTPEVCKKHSTPKTFDFWLHSTLQTRPPLADKPAFHLDIAYVAWLYTHCERMFHAASLCFKRFACFIRICFKCFICTLQK